MRKKKTSRQSLPAMFYCRLDTRCALPAILNRQSGGILQPLPSNFLLREGDMSRKPSEGVGTRTRAASASVVVDKRSRGHDAAPPSSGASHGTVGSKGATTDMARKRTRVSEVPPIKPLARHGEDVGEPERPPVRVGWVLLRGAVATAPRAASPCVHTGTGRCVTPAFLATAPNHGACPLPPRVPAAPRCLLPLHPHMNATILYCCVVLWPPRRVPRHPAFTRARGDAFPPPLRLPPLHPTMVHAPCLPAPLLLPVSAACRVPYVPSAYRGACGRD